MEDKKSYLQKMADQLNEWDAEIKKFKQKTVQKKEGLKAEYQKAINEVQSKRDAMKMKMEEMNEVSEEAWKNFSTSTKINTEEATRKIGPQLLRRIADTLLFDADPSHLR